MLFKNIKPSSRLNRAWWITLGAILIAMFVMGAAETPTGTAETEKPSAISEIYKQTGISEFIEGFRELGMNEEELAALNAERAEELRIANEEAQIKLDKMEEAKKTKTDLLPQGVGQLVMLVVCLLLIYLAIVKDFEPLLLLPIGFGGILANIPITMMGNAASVVGQPDGFLYTLFHMGIDTGLFPLLIFVGVGAMTDFGPLIANPKTALLGAAAQFGIFTTLLGALFLADIGFYPYTIEQAASIGIIGGADGPTSIFVASRLAPELLGSIAVAAYSYMALVPIIQPPIMRFCTSKADRAIRMEQLRHVGRLEKILFPLIVLFLCIFLLPDATPLLGALMLGNLARESGVVNRLSKTMENELINIVTIFLGLSVGSKLSADKFLNASTLGILFLGFLAFSVGTASGVLLARFMNLFSKKKINPLIGSAGVSAVPMAARVSNKVGLEANPQNFLLMHAMGPNVSGVIGSAVAAGVLLALL